LVFAPPDESGLLVGYAISDDGRYLVLTLREGSRSQNRVLYKDLARPGSAVGGLFPTPDANYTLPGSGGKPLWLFPHREEPRGRRRSREAPAGGLEGGRSGGRRDRRRQQRRRGKRAGDVRRPIRPDVPQGRPRRDAGLRPHGTSRVRARAAHGRPDLGGIL